tara:strand:+ start:484 stop:1725 length:1242 start_codon:yes stop_codon:yes gene_type:complete
MLNGLRNFFSIEIFSLLILFIFYSSIFSSFIGTTIPSFFVVITLIIVNLNKIKIRGNEYKILITITLVIYTLIVIALSQDTLVALKNFRFWFGVIFYLYFLMIYDIKFLYTRNFFKIICFTIFVEAILINLIDHNFLLDFINIEPYKHFNFYYRPIGFTGSASMTSTALVVLFYLTHKLNRKMSISDWALLTITILIIYSSSGYLIFLAFIMLFFLSTIKQILYMSIYQITVKDYLYLMIFIFIIYVFYKALILLGNEVKVGTNLSLYSRISSDYFIKIYELKIQEYILGFNNLLQPAVHCKADCIDTFGSNASYAKIQYYSDLITLFGYQIIAESPLTAGHNGLTIFSSTMGVLGLCIYILLLLLFNIKNNPMNYGIILILVASLHYPVAMSGAGQLLLASMLLINTKRQEY